MKHKILIVEDSKPLAKVLKTKVEKALNKKTTVCHTLAETKVAIQNEGKDFFVALLDLTLPDAPNGEVVDFVIKNDIPVIVITGSIDLKQRESISAKFIVDYVVKNTTRDIDYAVGIVKQLQENIHTKVLIVDDAVLYRDAMKDLVIGHQFKVYEAEDGLDALEVLEEHPDISIVITDYEMPNMNGIELAEHIRRKYTKDQLALLAVSASDKQDLASLFIKYGANDFIPKPFTKEIFYTRLNAAVENLTLKRKLKENEKFDHVTNVYNRKHFISYVEKEYQKAYKNDVPYAIGVIDIDNFKYINENYGSKVGDRVLHNVASLMQKATKSKGIAARYSSDQFVIAMEDIDNETLSTYFNYLHKAIDKETIILEDGTELDYKISIGVAKEKKESLETFIKSAFVYLWLAKDGEEKVVIEQ